MPNGEMFGSRKTITGAVGELIIYPFTHPKETAKTVAVGGLAVASTLIASQVTMLVAEHGGIRWQRQEPPEVSQSEIEEQYEQ
jgi:hypothetical protein